MRACTSAFNHLMFPSFILDDVGVTRSDFSKCRTCLNRIILKTHSTFCLRNVIRLDVYSLVIITIYYEPVTPPWKVAYNSIYPPVCSIVTTRKGVYI